MSFTQHPDFQGLALPSCPGGEPRAWLRYWRRPVSLRHPVDEPRPGRFGSIVGRPARARARALMARAKRQGTEFGYFTKAELRSVARGDRGLTHKLLTRAEAYLDRRLHERAIAADLAARPFHVGISPNGPQLRRREPEA